MTTNMITTSNVQVVEFELAQRRAKAFSQSTMMVPESFRGNLGDCLIAEEMAQRLGASTLQVMQNIHIIHGRPSFSAKFLIACWNASGKYGPIDYDMSGEGMEYGCIASSTRTNDGKIITGPRVTIGIASAEGWLSKKGSKWKTMPDLMLRYRAATMLINTTDPGLSMGMMTVEEAQDVGSITATVLPDLPGEDDKPTLSPIADRTAGSSEIPSLRGKLNDYGTWYGEKIDDETGEIVWGDASGATFDTGKNQWREKNNMPAYDKDGFFILLATDDTIDGHIDD